MLWGYAPARGRGRELHDLPSTGTSYGHPITSAPQPYMNPMASLYDQAAAMGDLYGLPAYVRTEQRITGKGGGSAPVGQQRPLHTVQEERAIDPNNPNMGSCTGPHEIIRRYTRSAFITHGDSITDSTPIP